MESCVENVKSVCVCEREREREKRTWEWREDMRRTRGTRENLENVRKGAGTKRGDVSYKEIVRGTGAQRERTCVEGVV